MINSALNGDDHKDRVDMSCGWRALRSYAHVNLIHGPWSRLLRRAYMTMKLLDTFYFDRNYEFKKHSLWSYAEFSAIKRLMMSINNFAGSELG